MRKVINVVPAVRDDIQDLTTRRAMPNESLQMIDPFLFLNHHGPQTYPRNNRGLPFGPHPHRGFETVTIIIEGDIAHKDSGGNESVINAGGVQWMTAGRGLIHEEVSSYEFKQNGGPLEILQLWVNLPSRLKMSDPSYRGVQREEIQLIEKEGCRIELISGILENIKGTFETLTPVTSMIITADRDTLHTFSIPAEHNIFFYVIRGSIDLDNKNVSAFHTVLFDNSASDITFRALTETKILLCYCIPLNEPVVSYGPFVMNTREEIMKAIEDFQKGKFN